MRGWGRRFTYTFSDLARRHGLAFTDPFFEGGGVLLADDDLFVNGEGQLHADLALFEGFEAFDIIGVDNIFPIGTIEKVLIQFVFQFAEVALFGHIFPVLFIDEEDEFVFGEEVAGVFDADGLEFCAFADEDAGSFPVGP